MGSMGTRSLPPLIEVYVRCMNQKNEVKAVKLLNGILSIFIDAVYIESSVVDVESWSPQGWNHVS